MTQQEYSAEAVEAGHGFAPGDVVRYTPENRWCHHGIAVVQDDGHGRDTYWGNGPECYVAPSELVGGELIFRMGEFREAANEGEWEKYAPADRGHLPMGGYPERFFVRIDAEPDLETQIQNARAALQAAEDKVWSAVRAVKWAAEDLAKLEMQPSTPQHSSQTRPEGNDHGEA